MEKKESSLERIQTLLMCRVCGSKNVYSLKDGTIVCRKCGERRIKK